MSGKYCKLISFESNKKGTSKMAEKKSELKINALPIQIRETVWPFADKFIAVLGENLQSITVVGSSLTIDFRPGLSDINTVLVLKSHTLDSLKSIASNAKSMNRKKISPPLLMTPSYIERSLDVFGIELLDFQLIHQTIFGDDPFSTLTFEKKDVRLQCERELKAMLIRLRQGYIAASANKKLVRDILISSIKSLSPLLRAMLWLKNIDRPKETELIFKKTYEHFSINTDSLTNTEKWRHQKMHLDESLVNDTFVSIYTTVEKLSDIVDKLEV